MGAKPIPCCHGQYHQDNKDGLITWVTLLMMTILAAMNRIIEICFLLWIFVIEKVGQIILVDKLTHCTDSCAHFDPSNNCRYWIWNLLTLQEIYNSKAEVKESEAR